MIKVPDFQLVKPVPEAIFEKYADQVPEEMVEFWHEYGFGSFRDGFMKTIDPDEWTDLLADMTEIHPDGIPLFLTGLGDLIIYTGDSVNIYRPARNDFDVIAVSMKYFFGDFYDDENFLLEEEIKWDPYPAALEKYGPIAYDECFGYVPLLALGGPNKVDNLEKVKAREYMLLNLGVTGLID